MTYEYPINVFMEEKIKLRKEESIRIGLGTACFFFLHSPVKYYLWLLHFIKNETKASTERGECLASS